jgi:hypothetical protein
MAHKLSIGRLLFRYVMPDLRLVMLIGHFSWAAVFDHARFALMRAGAKWFRKFRPAWQALNARE